MQKTSEIIIYLSNSILKAKNSLHELCSNELCLDNIKDAMKLLRSIKHSIEFKNTLMFFEGKENK